MEKEALCQMIFDQITKYLAPNHPTIMKTPMEMKTSPLSKSNKRVVLNILSSDLNLEDGPVDVVFGTKGFRPDEKPDIHGMCDSTSMQSDRDYDALGDPSDETLKPDSAEEEQPEIGDLCENTASHVLPSSEIQDDRRNSGGKRNPYALSMHDLSPADERFKFLSVQDPVEASQLTAWPKVKPATPLITNPRGNSVSPVNSGNDISNQLRLALAQRDKLALELDVLRLQQSQQASSTQHKISTDTSLEGLMQPTRKKRHVDWPHKFTPDMPRAQASLLSKEGDLECSSTQEDLDAENCWLPWNEVVRAVGLQRDRFELAVPIKSRARECCNLVMLSLYSFIPPSRGPEIRTPEIVNDRQSFDRGRYKTEMPC
ncbi:hypothetical protein OS493_020421 [Desmophyllum pertusum]|uniref:Uncharacterized protein n=1 Tax=Desmophyllum pertusum TaxID=174260 RepID=A0A9X0CYA0_9CNID|nr:hypothetical protein OS493_020421 [Desmophyllum pertusum]